MAASDARVLSGSGISLRIPSEAASSGDSHGVDGLDRGDDESPCLQTDVGSIGEERKLDGLNITLAAGFDAGVLVEPVDTNSNGAAGGGIADASWSKLERFPPLDTWTPNGKLEQ